MKMPHRLIIEIMPDGKITGEVKDVSGPHCSALTAWLDSLGEVTLDQATPDFHKKDKNTVSVKR